MSNDFNLDDFKNTMVLALNDDQQDDILDTTLVELINIIRLNEVASSDKVLSDRARKDRVTKVLDKLYAKKYQTVGSQ